jgi:ABC-type Fe3+-hydroxamate transport system substrate-binding protein
MRRVILAALLTVSAATACSAEQATPVSPGGGGGAGTFPITIEHKFGSTTIPERPDRVLSLGYQEHDAIFALGVTPIAVRYWYGDESDVVFPWAEDEAGDADPEILNMPSGELKLREDRRAAAGPHPWPVLRDHVAGVRTALADRPHGGPDR